MATLQPYKKYNAIAYDYAKQLPGGWQLLPNIAIFEERIERGYENEELLSVTIGRGVIKQSDLDKKDSSTLDKSKYLLVYPDDLVYSMRFRQGASGYSNYKGIVSPACTVLKPRKGIKYNPRYFHYMFRTGFYKNYAERYAYGIADGQMPLRYCDFKRMYSIVPPIEMQNSIVAYLDKKNNEINKFIRNKERLIGLLEEEKISFIHKSINNVSNSERKRLKFACFLSRGYDLSSDKFKEGKYPIYGSNGIIGYHNISTTKGPCITVGRSGSVGEVNYVETDFWAHNTSLYVYRNYKNNWKFLFYLLLTLDMKSYALGSAVGTLNRNNVHEIFVNIPKIEDQISIVKNIENELNKINSLISKARKEISSIKEYREAIIANLVTGKRRVPQLQMC